MTKHGGTFKFSAETRDLLGKNRDFFDSIISLYDEKDPDKTPLKILSKDPEARTEAKIQTNGDVEVSFVFPLDSNADAADGRIYFRDTFVFDASEEKLKSYNRSFEYNGKGSGNWQAWLEKYKATLKDNPLTVDSPSVQKFAGSAGRSFGRPVTDEDGNTLPEIKEVWTQDHRYIDAINQLVGDQQAGLKLKIKDKRNVITLVPNGDVLEATFTLAIDGDDDPANGRILLREKFTLDAKTMAFKALERKWELAPESAGNEEWQNTRDALAKTANPTDADAATFIKNLLPVLLSGPDLQAANGLPRMVSPLILPKDYQSPMAKRLAGQGVPNSERQAGNQEAFEAIYAVAVEDLHKRYDASLGWAYRGPKIDLKKEESVLQALFQKAAAELKTSSASSAFAVLKSIKLEGSEAEERNRILDNSLMQKIDSIGQELDTELRAQDFLLLAREDLLKEAGFGGAAVQLAQRLVSVDAVKQQAGEILALAQGKGSTGVKMDFLMPRFAKEVFNWKSLAAMGAAPFLGVGAELTGLKLFGKIPALGRVIPSAMGIGGEAMAFTAIHRTLNAAYDDPKKFKDNFWGETASAALLFGAMRVAHYGSGWISGKMAEGKFGTLFGSKPGPGAVPSFVVSPTGRLLTDSVVGGWQLTRLGRLLSFTLSHGGGVLAMHGAGVLSRRWKFQPDNNQGTVQHLFDAAVMYGQAMVSFNFANFLTHGKLQSGLAESRIQLENYRSASKGQTTPEAAKARPITTPPRSGELRFKVKAGPESWAFEPNRNVKRLWIGSGLNGKKQVLYTGENAILDVGVGHPTISQHHAVLLRDESGTFWYLGDAGSTYGTYVGDRKLHPGESVLVDSDLLVQLGDDLQFRLEVEGKLLKPDEKMTTIVKVPVHTQQHRLAPPEPADVFPLKRVFGDEIPEDANLTVATLTSMRGKVIPLRNDTAAWNIGRPTDPVARIFIDAKGRWILQKLDPNTTVEVARPKPEGGEHRWILEKTNSPSEDKGRHDWVFIEPGDGLILEHQGLTFEVPQPKLSPKPSAESRALGRGGAVEVPIHKAGAFLDPEVAFEDKPTGIMRRSGEAVFPNLYGDPGQAEAIADEVSIGDRPTVVTDYSQRTRGPDDTLPGIPVPMDLPDVFPPEFLQKIPEGHAPFELQVGNRLIRADRTHTSYVLGSDPETSQPHQATVRLEGNRVDNSHAEIFLGKKVGEGEEYHWYLIDRGSELGVFANGYRRLEKDERLLLTPETSFSLGEPRGIKGGVQILFDMPWAPRQRMSSSSIHPAEFFPSRLLAKLDPQAPSMSLRSNLGHQAVLEGDRVHTSYLLGTNPGEATSGNVELVAVTADKVADKHCEIFVDPLGQWYLRALSSTEKTYVKGKEVLPAGPPQPLHSGDEIALGGNASQGHGMTLIFQKPEYLSPDHRSSRPSLSRPSEPPDSDEEAEVNTGEYELVDRDQASAGPGETIHELGSDEMRTVVPPPTPVPAPVARVAPLRPPSPPVLGARPATVPPAPAGPVDPLIGNLNRTVIMPVSPELLAKTVPGGSPQGASAEVSEPDPTADWGREFADEAAQGSPAPGAPPAVDPVATPVAVPRPPAAGSETAEVSFADVVEPPIDAASSTGKTPDSSPADISPQGDGMWTLTSPIQDPSAAVEPQPIASEAPSRLAVDFSLWHPDLKSPAMLKWLEPFLQEGRDELKLALKTLVVFPELGGGKSKRLQGESADSFTFLTKLVGLDVGSETENGPKGPAISEPVKAALMELTGLYWLAGKFHNQYQLESDGKLVRFSAFPEKGPLKPNTVLTLSLKAGAEVKTLHAVYHHLLTLGVPVDVLVPIKTEGVNAPAIGVFYSSEHATEVQAAVDALSREHPNILENRLLPFSHQMKDSAGQPIPGASVLEYSSTTTIADPLQHRAHAIARAFSHTIKNTNETGVYDPKFYMRELLIAFSEAGYDLNNPGFRKGSATGSHQDVVEYSIADPLPDPEF